MGSLLRSIRGLRRILAALAAFVFIVFAGAYYWLILENHVPEVGLYKIDMAEVRRLASAIPGDKPREIRVEQIAAFRFPNAIVASGGWGKADLPVFSYQVVYPDRTIVIDTGLDEETARAHDAASFDGAAFRRMDAALDAASLVVITHEHFDHTGGLAHHANLASVLSHTRLTREQLDHPERMAPVTWPGEVLKGYTPLTYDRVVALAPGIVLIKAPGHSPGSQMVFVQRSDGAEYLLLGDVAWHFRNIEELRQRARLVTWLVLSEDRDAVMHELVELRRLHTIEPSLHIVPGHDGGIVTRLIDQGWLSRGFRL